MTTIHDFLRALEALAASAPTYRTGGTGADGTCDCIGATMGALYALGRTRYPLHSSNYFARFEVDDLRPLTTAGDCYPGMQVFKAREGAPINARYLPGGRYCTGDLLDYYHAGVVMRVDPLEILHCTSSAGANGFARDGRLGKWTHGGRIRGVDYGEADAGDGDGSCAHGGSPSASPSASAASPSPALAAYVYAPSGSTVNLRAEPSRRAARLARVPIGARVEVLRRGERWCRVRHDGRKGWMMSQYLCSSLPPEAAS